MKIFRIGKNRSYEIPFETFKFPDGQLHLTLGETPHEETDYFIQASISSIDKLFEVMLAANIVDVPGTDVGLEIHYLLGARMDRRMNERWPVTANVIADMINSCNFEYVDILDPHSPASIANINCVKVFLPHKAFWQCVQEVVPQVIVIPDIGAINRVMALCDKVYENNPPHFVRATKIRDSATGKLTFGEFVADGPVDDVISGKSCLIVDDICDGGATFVNLAKELHDLGARSVNLFVTHALMSKGQVLKGIRHTYTTDSYRPALYGPVSPYYMTVYSAAEEFENA